jgi:hypothetical protein
MWEDENREFVRISKEMFYHYLSDITFCHLLVEIPGKRGRNWVTIADNLVNSGTGCYRSTNKVQCSSTVPWLKQLVVGLLSQRAGFYSRSILVQFMADRIFTEYFASPACIIPPILHIHISLMYHQHYTTLAVGSVVKILYL